MSTQAQYIEYDSQNISLILMVITDRFCLDISKCDLSSLGILPTRNLTKKLNGF